MNNELSPPEHGKPVITVCRQCKGENIAQQAVTMLPVNEPFTPPSLNDLWMDGIYWCEDCDDECQIEMKEDKV